MFFPICIPFFSKKGLIKSLFIFYLIKKNNTTKKKKCKNHTNPPIH